MMKNRYKFFLKRILYYLYEKNFKRLDYNWEKFPSRFEIIQNIITQQKYNNYLEIDAIEMKIFPKLSRIKLV